MDQKAVEAVRKWRFRAGTKDGAAVAVRVQVEVNFGLQLEPKMWGTGPLIFASTSGVMPPVLISGTMPSTSRDAANETVLLQFTVSPDGEVGEIRALEGEGSTSLPMLMSSISKWRFSPAATAAGPIPVTGKILLIKGASQFRYEASSAFRDSGATRPPEHRPASDTASASNAARPVTVVTVPVRISLDPDEAKRQLVEQVPPQYPAEASKAKIQGTVVLAIVIGADGGIKDIREIDGPPELIPAAVAAVKQWRYHPALFRGQPREASTEVEIQFKLPE
jgi:TonB family protein